MPSSQLGEAFCPLDLEKRGKSCATQPTSRSQRTFNLDPISNSISLNDESPYMLNIPAAFTKCHHFGGSFKIRAHSLGDNKIPSQSPTLKTISILKRIDFDRREFRFGFHNIELFPTQIRCTACRECGISSNST